ncbi:PilW family protein [Noviherbaspirillum sedimenti]|nr:PilW family protein [Noviherbaspirillum sedimenti]
MKKQERSLLFFKGQSGFSLIELMVAITIGFIVVLAVSYLYLGSNQVFRATDNMSRLQENARYALDNMARHVRMTGYIGCGNLQNMTVTVIANAPAEGITTANAVSGLDYVSPAAAIGGITRPAGDTISIRGMFREGVPVTEDGQPSNANLKIADNRYGFAQGDVLTVTNCTHADTFKVTNNPGAATLPGVVNITTLTHANSTNTGNRLGKYGTDAIVSRIDQYSYFVGVNPASKRALFRSGPTSADAPVELADNVEDMQIEYGVDTNGDSAADSYLTATSVGADWDKVVTARIHLLMASAENNVASSAQRYVFNGATVTATDRRLYQVFTTTVGLRNRLP